MPDYVAHVTVPEVTDDVREGMFDALGALRDDGPETLTGPTTITFDLRGEAPDPETAERAAATHAAEVLDDIPHRVSVELLG